MSPIGRHGSPARDVGPAAASPVVLPMVLLGALLAAAGSAACAGSGAAVAERAARLRVEVQRGLPHDPRAFTQGLVLVNGELYESVGRYGRSAVRRLDRETGEVLAETALPPELFGEGLAAVGERLIQLTWREGVAIVYDRRTLAEEGRLRYDGEGWGLCDDGRRLYQSDGSANLTVRHRESFAELERLAVTLDGRPLDRLNELECAEGWIYANVFGSDQIVRIDPLSGRVAAVIDASGLLTPRQRRAADVLNGIAFDPASGRFLVTGKLWPRMFEVEFVE